MYEYFQINSKNMYFYIPKNVLRTIMEENEDMEEEKGHDDWN
jgi:hypothetical protein